MKNSKDLSRLEILVEHAIELINEEKNLYKIFRQAALESKDLNTINKLIESGLNLGTLDEEDSNTILNTLLIQDPFGPITLRLIAHGARLTKDFIHVSSESYLSDSIIEHIINVEDFIEKISINNFFDFHPETILDVWNNFSFYDDVDIENPEAYIAAIATRAFKNVSRDNVRMQMIINYNMEENFNAILSYMSNIIDEYRKHLYETFRLIAESTKNLDYAAVARHTNMFNNVSNIISSKSKVSLYLKDYYKSLECYYKQDKKKFGDNFFSNTMICKDSENQLEYSLPKILPNEIIAHIISYLTLQDLNQLFLPLHIKLLSSTDLIGEQEYHMEY